MRYASLDSNRCDICFELLIIAMPIVILNHHPVNLPVKYYRKCVFMKFFQPTNNVMKIEYELIFIKIYTHTSSNRHSLDIISYISEKLDQ